MDELLSEFLAESRRDLDRLVGELIRLEAHPRDTESLASVFRAIHTLKGTSSFLGYDQLEALAHAGESLLSKLRDGELALDTTIADVLLELAEAAREVLVCLEERGREGEHDHAALLAVLERLGQGHATHAPRRARPAVRNVARPEITASAGTLPVEQLWNRLPQLVRDLARRTQKEVRLELEGQGIALDRHVIAALQGPLMHALRNCVDHGIESPAERRAAGKPAEGCIRVRARVVNARFELEIADDGRGIALAEVRATAIARGLATPEAAARLGERELFELVSLPGFSTRAEVSGLSGRGVGLDVVRSTVEGLGGALELRSIAGHSTTLVITLPEVRG